MPGRRMQSRRFHSGGSGYVLSTLDIRSIALHLLDRNAH